MPKKKLPKVHGNKGVYFGGQWLPIEDCDNWLKGMPNDCKQDECPRHERKNKNVLDDASTLYDVAIVGAGCIGGSIARELSKYSLKCILLERDDDVTQGATKGNSGIVHAGYDDKPGSVRAKFCWPGNQMFSQLDKELRFGYLKNGSIVIAKSEKEIEHLNELYQRGITNGVKNLKILNKEELRAKEPYVSEEYIAGLYSPDAGTITPYEFTIALCENAAQNGVQVRTRHEVNNIKWIEKDKCFNLFIKEWSYDATSNIKNVVMDKAARRMFTETKSNSSGNTQVIALLVVGLIVLGLLLVFNVTSVTNVGILAIILFGTVYFIYYSKSKSNSKNSGKNGKDGTIKVKSENADEVEYDKVIKARYVINSGGLFADKIARMIGDDSFTILPRLGEYILLDKTQGHLANCTLFPVPGPMGKGVLVQTTLWGNLILGPTARDVHNPKTMSQTKDEILSFILSKTKGMVPSIDATKVIHSFAGARAKSDRKDWIIEMSKSNNHFINVAGIDSPGLAGSPAIALYVVNMIKDFCQRDKYVSMNKNENFEANRKPLIFPKRGWVGIKLKKYKENGGNKCQWTEEEIAQMKKNVICKCEMVTEYEIVDALHRPGASVDTTQAIRRRTRAGMGHCQADPDNIDCEKHVAQIIAREKGIKENQVGRRPWPATSLLKQRWLTDEDKKKLDALSLNG